ncbi:MAG: OmpW family protein [Rubrivivax sp.]|nr:OmpW family protein [Rubrivivax sp.]
MKIATPFAAAIAATAALSCTAALAQDYVLKAGVTRYDTHSKTSGLVTDPAVPALAGSDAETGDATTVILVIERTLTPNIGAELVLGWPPRIDAEATGPLAGLTRQLGISNTILSAKNVAPTLLVNYYFGDPSDALRPYVGGGVNYTRFTGVRSSLPASRLKMSDSWGPAVQVGLSYALAREWGLFASVARVWVKSDVEAVVNLPNVPVPVSVKTTVDFRPWTYSAGAFYRF